jgi:hypothetical protein
MKAAHTLILLAAALMLGGCNLVVSQTPVFSSSDAAGAPPFKPGFWASPDPGCDFKESAPFDAWPKCANGSEIQRDALIATVDPTAVTATTSDNKTASGPKKVGLPYVLAAGDPRVMQVDLHIPEAGLGQLGFFYFVAVKPTRFDDDGRITAAQLWPIQCGPPPPPQTTQSANGGDLTKGAVTEHPLPGLKIANGECNPVDKDAVRNAASPSRAWADNVGELHWVRGTR